MHRVLLLLLLVPAIALADEPPSTPLRVQVLDVETRAPLPGIKVEVRHYPGEDTHTTDEAGRLETRIIHDEYPAIALSVLDAGDYAAVRYHWSGEKDATPPEVLTMELPRARSIGGIVVNETGDPVAGAEVYMIHDGIRQGEWDLSDAIPDNHVGISDSQGRWQYDKAMPEIRDHWLRVNHPDYVGDNVYNRRPSVEDLFARSVRFVLKRGLTLSGKVVDHNGAPIEHARVSAGRFSPDHVEMTDAEGTFALSSLDREQQLLVVQHAKFAPQHRLVEAANIEVPQTFTLKEGNSIKLRVLTPEGDPVTDARVTLSGWGGGDELLEGLGASGRTNRRGEWRWRSAPDEPVTYEVHAQNWVHPKPLTVAADGSTHEITLKHPLVISGKVTDRDTGEPLNAGQAFKVCVWDSGGLHTVRQLRDDLDAGAFELSFERNDCGHKVMVEAMGYEPWFSETYYQSDDSVTLDIAMTPAPNLEGTVVDEAGAPVPDARVVICTPTMQVNLGSGGIENTWDYLEDTTDKSGGFTLPPQTDDYVLLVTEDQGYGEATRADFEEKPVIPLKAWASLSGTFSQGGEPVPGMVMTLSPIRPRAWGLPIVAEYYRTETADDGSFDFGKVPPRPFSLGGQIGPWIDSAVPSAPAVPVDLQPGERREVSLNGGRRVVGRLRLAEGDDRDFAFNWSINMLVKKDSGLSLDLPALDQFDVNEGWNEAWAASAEGQVFLGTLDRHHFRVQPDGAFVIEGVKPGNYDLACRLFAPPEGSCLTQPLKTVTTSFVVEEGSSESVDLGAVVADLRPPLEAGMEAPPIEAKKLDGTPFSLAGLKGKYVLLDFWATWCGPCKAELPNLKAAWERFGDKVAFVSLSLDSELAPVQRFVEREKLPWIQVHLGDWSRSDVPTQYQVSNIPQVILVDPAGRISAVYLRGPAMIKALEEAVSSSTE